MYNNSSTIGNIGETVALAEFAKRGIPVLIPFGQNVPYDLVVEIDGVFYRIQCKTTAKVKDGVKMLFPICRTNGFKGTHQSYTSKEVDFIFVYCIENGYMGLIPVQDVENMKSASFVIRLSISKNNQTKGIHMACDYEFDKQLGTFSSVGQNARLITE